MISSAEEEYILSKAYIPEHIVGLMTLISKGEPFLANDYIFFLKDNWLIFIGYPLEHVFSAEDFESTLKEVIRKHNPEITWFIAPEISDSFLNACHKPENDEYYRLNLDGTRIKNSLLRHVKLASKKLTVDRERKIQEEHKGIISEFLENENPSPMIRQLFLSMADYVDNSKDSLVLSARGEEKNLSAFYVVDLAARSFATYVIGCYSRKNYIPHASDLLFFEMINLAKEHGKGYINLGLGVNEGIKRFKIKWGGIPFLKYKFCELSTKQNKIFEFIRLFESKF